MTLPENVVFILNTLHQKGFKAYVVGGCVRDYLMGISPHDYDITTSALPHEVENIFADFKVIETGLKHGTLTVLIDDIKYEITTFRIESDYSDGRHPDKIKFVSNIHEDLKRRDYTINAIAYNKKEGFIDPFNGIEDIQNKVIRAVGNPDARFTEDPLRILRGVRFSNKYKMNIEKETKKSMNNLKKLLRNVSEERISEELKQIIVFADYASLIDNKEILFEIIPELKEMDGFKQNNPHHYLDIWEHTAKAISEAPENATIRLALLFHDIGKVKTYSEDENGVGHFYHHARVSEEISEEILKKLRFSNKEISDLLPLIKYHDITMSNEIPFARRWKAKLGDNIYNLLDVMTADRMAQVKTSDFDESMKLIKAVKENLKTVEAEEKLMTVRDLKINGNDLMNIGLKGPEIGKMQKFLLELVMENPTLNEKEALLEKAKASLVLS